MPKSQMPIPIVNLQQNPKYFYQNLLTAWIQHQYQNSADNIIIIKSQQYFHKQFLKKIHKQSHLPILLDKRAYLALLELQKLSKYYNINGNTHDSSNSNNSKDGKDRDKSIIILQIAEILWKNGFITIGMFKHVQNNGSYQNSIKARVQKLINKARKMKNDQIQELQKLWYQQFCQFKLQFVWQNLIYPNIQKLKFKSVQQLYFWYSPLISSKHPSLNITLQLTFQPDSIPKQSLIRHILHQHIKPQSKNPQYQQQRQQTRELELNNLYTFIQKTIKQKYPSINVRIQLFGSARSGLGLHDCDYDISLFCLDSNKEHVDNKVYNILELLCLGFYSNKKYTVNAQNILAAKAPVLKLQLNNKIVKNVDIVLNNMHGVENSRYLASYSENQSIKEFILLIKIWAKKYRLVHFQKLSSYGITFMALYFLMKNGNIAESTKYQVQRKSNSTSQSFSSETKKTKIKARPLLIKSINLFQDFNNFLSFYSKNGPHMQSNQCICLLERENKINDINSCEKIHSKIVRPYFVFNMHDPFNDTNPGRLKKDNADEFFNAIHKSLKTLSSSNKQIFEQFSLTDKEKDKLKS